MEVITKKADGSRSSVFMDLVNVLNALVSWWSGSRQTQWPGSSGSL